MYDILGSGGDWESGEGREGRGGRKGRGEGREVGQAEGEDAGEVVTEPPLPIDSFPRNLLSCQTTCLSCPAIIFILQLKVYSVKCTWTLHLARLIC